MSESLTHSHWKTSSRSQAAPCAARSRSRSAVEFTIFFTRGDPRPRLQRAPRIPTRCYGDGRKVFSPSTSSPATSGSKWTVYRLVRSRELPAVRVGERIRFRPATLTPTSNAGLAHEERQAPALGEAQDGVRADAGITVANQREGRTTRPIFAGSSEGGCTPSSKSWTSAPSTGTWLRLCFRRRRSDRGGGVTLRLLSV